MVTVTTSANVNSSADLERILQLKLQLSPHVSIAKQQIRGEPWFVLSNELNDSQLRLPTDTMLLLNCLKKDIPLAEAIRQAEEITAQNSIVYPQSNINLDDVIKLLFSLQEMNMLVGDIAYFNQPGDKKLANPRSWTRRLIRPLAIQVPLLNPDRLLGLLLPFADRIFGQKFIYLLGILVVTALLVAVREASDILLHFQSRFLDPGNLISLWFIYPVLKAVHELAHGLTCRWRGGAVKEMGIMLLVFVPVPYVNATASNAFSLKSDRVLVSAAGILAEVCMAAIAILAWSVLPSGYLSDIAFNVALIGSVSTIIFNGNPLLKFDGYYILSDLIEIPGLATRSGRYIGYLLKRYLFRLKAITPPNTAVGETKWFLVYGLASTIYRIILSFSIALYVMGKFFALGLLLGLWYLTYQIVGPALKHLQTLTRQSIQEQRLGKTYALLGLSTLLPLAVIFFIPVPNSTYAEGIVIVPEENSIRVTAAGFISQLPKQNMEVKAGDVIAQLDNDELELDYRLAKADLTRARVEYASTLGNNSINASIYHEQVEYLSQQVDVASKKVEALTIRAPSGGEFTSYLSENDIGKYFERGMLIGQIGDNRAAVVQVAVPQQAIETVRSDSQEIEARLSGDSGTINKITLLREVPKVSSQLPNRLLGSAAGGSLPSDMRDSSGYTTKDPFFLMEVSLPIHTNPYIIGQKVVLRFRHKSAPVARQLYYWISTKVKAKLQANQ